MLPLFPDVKQRGGDREVAILPGGYSVMTHHPVPGGPHTGREEKVTITGINKEEGLPVTV